jgi:membrane protein
VSKLLLSLRRLWRDYWRRIQNLKFFQNPHFRNVIAVISSMIKASSEHEISFRSAALAYYGLFSLFPLLLFLVFIGSQFLESTNTQQALFKSLTEILPGASGTVKQVIDQTIKSRGSIGLVGGIGLLWTASTLFNQLTTSLNLTWGAKPRPFWRRRLVALFSVLSIAILFILSIALSALSVIQLPGQGTVIWQWLTFSVGLGITVLLFWLLYHEIPNVTVSVRASLSGAILSALLWQAAKTFFALYLASGLNNYGTVYGSLASVIALVLWAYISALILFLGAEFGAALQRVVWPVNPEREDSKTEIGQ